MCPELQVSGHNYALPSDIREVGCSAAGAAAAGSQVLSSTQENRQHITIYKIDKDILYSTGNSTQYSIMAYMGKEPKKEWIYVYV